MRQLFVFLVLCLAAGGAKATVIMPLETGELIERSELIVTGEVVSVRSAAVIGGSGVVTYVRVAVEAYLRGALPEREIVVRVPGGRLAERFAWVHGMPEFRRGESVLLLLAGDREAELRLVGMYQGKFELRRDRASGQRRARRRAVDVLAITPFGSGPAPDVDLDLEQIRHLIQVRKFRGAARTLRAFPGDYAANAAAGKESEAFTLLSGARWPEQLTPVGFRVAPGFQAGTSDGGRPTVQAGMQAWNDVPGSSLELYDAGTGAPARVLLCNFASEVNFNDPFGEIPDGEGILAVGGFCALGPYIIEGNLTFNDDAIATAFFALPNCFAHVATHELGHTIGLGHSLNPLALMAPTVSPSTCRGASLHADDILGAQFLYGGATSSVSLPPPAGVYAYAFGNFVIVGFSPVAGADRYEIVALGACDPCATVDSSPLVGIAPDGVYDIAVRARDGDDRSPLSRVVRLTVGR